MSNLIIDTTLGSFVAVVQEDKVLSCKYSETQNKQVENLAPLVKEILQEVERAQIDRIFVGVGPAPFTGLRVGLALAKGVAKGLNIESKNILGFSMHDILAISLSKTTIQTDAKRHQIYQSTYNQEFERISQDIVAIDNLDDNFMVNKLIFPDKIAQTLAKLISQKSEIVNLPDLPLYLRPADAIPNIKPAIKDLRSVEIVRGRMDDIPAISHLEEVLFSREKWSENSITEAMKRDDYVFFLIKVDGEIAGATYIFLPMFKDDQVNLMSVGVLPEFQRQGLGHKLLKRTLDYAKEVGYSKMLLEVRTQNEKAKSLYKQYGFHKIALVKKFYQAPPDDALVMEVDL
jgi:ribosomal-protein-alanine N-acetyltransferase